MIEVKVKNIGLDSTTGSPILILSDINNEEDLYPIWIGVSEAEGIIMKQSGVETPRPMTYDLIVNIIENLGGKVKEVSITDMKDNAYIAEIIVEQNGNEIKIDARPSDAVNIALRFEVPIYLNEEVVKKVNIKEITAEDLKNEEKSENQEFEEVNNVEDLVKEPEIDEELEKFKEFIENIKPEDFAKKPEENNNNK
jgi:hypothetical protein